MHIFSKLLILALVSVLLTACGPSCPDGPAVSVDDIQGPWKITESTLNNRDEGFVRFEPEFMDWIMPNLTITRGLESFGDHGIRTSELESSYEESFCLELNGDELTMNLVDGDAIVKLQKLQDLPAE